MKTTKNKNAKNVVIPISLWRRIIPFLPKECAETENFDLMIQILDRYRLTMMQLHPLLKEYIGLVRDGSVSEESFKNLCAQVITGMVEDYVPMGEK